MKSYKLRRVYVDFCFENLTSDVIDIADCCQPKLEQVIHEYWFGTAIFSKDLSREKESALKRRLLKSLINAQNKHIRYLKNSIALSERNKKNLVDLANECGGTLK